MMRSYRGLAAWLLAGTMLTAVTPAMAPAAEIAQATMETFAITGQPLDQALAAFSAQTRIQVLAKGEVTRGVPSPGASGRLSPEDALRRLLSGTGITYHFTDARTVILDKVAADGAMTLDPVTVEGAALPGAEETAWGPVQGYVAKRSATGTKTDTPIVEIPQSISVITRDQMEAQGVQTVEQALAYTPGVTVGQFGDDARYDQFNLRGFNGNTTSVYLDGLRQWGAVFTYPQNEIYGLEKIDVMRGPSSVLYGQVAPGGLVDAVSKRPTQTPLHEVAGSIGSNDRFQGQFDFSDALDEKGRFQYRVTGLLRDADGEIKGTPDNRRFIAPAVTWRPNEDTSLTILAQYQDMEANGWPYYYSPNGTASRIWVGDPNYNDFDLTQYHTGYLLEHRFNDMWQVRQNFRYGHVKLDSQYVMAWGTVGNVLSRYAGTIAQDMDTYALDNQAQADFATGPLKHTMLFGIGYDHMRYEMAEGGFSDASLDLNLLAPVYGLSITDPDISERSRQTQQQIGGYLQDQIKIGQLALTLGGRWDRATGKTEDLMARTQSSQVDKKFTGKAGAVYLFENGLAPYASYSESFQPTAGTDFHGVAFRPTTGQQEEIGVKFQPPGHNSFVGVAVYDLTQQNVTTQDPDHPTARVQTGEIRSRGFEAEAKAELTESLNLIAAYTYTDAEVTKSNTTNLGKAPVVIPKHTASIWADYTLKSGPMEGFGFGSGLRYIGENYSDAVNTLKNDSYVLVDAMARYDLSAVDPDLKGVQATVNVSNLFDKDVAVCNGGSCSWMAGRTVMGKLSYRW